MKVNSISMKLLISIAVVGMTLSGCSSTKNLLGKRDNGSLDYQQSRLLAPIQLPVDKQPKTFTPLYPLVQAGKSPINVTNSAGKQYQLPAPRRIGRMVQ